MRKVVLGALFVGIALAVVGVLNVINSAGEKVDDRLPAVVSSPPAPRVSLRPDTIREGTWEVGTDVKPGKYKTRGAVDSRIPMCYWDVKVGDEITDQGVKDQTDAQGIVTLKKGEVFTTSGCEEWYAVK